MSASTYINEYVKLRDNVWEAFSSSKLETFRSTLSPPSSAIRNNSHDVGFAAKALGGGGRADMAQ